MPVCLRHARFSAIVYSLHAIPCLYCCNPCLYLTFSKICKRFVIYKEFDPSKHTSTQYGCELCVGQTLLFRKKNSSRRLEGEKSIFAYVKFFQYLFNSANV